MSFDTLRKFSNHGSIHALLPNRLINYSSFAQKLILADEVALVMMCD